MAVTQFAGAEFKYLLSILGGSQRCPRSCSGKGLCKDEKCFCDNGYYGRDCSILITEIPKDRKVVLDTNEGTLCLTDL